MYISIAQYMYVVSIPCCNPRQLHASKAIKIIANIAELMSSTAKPETTTQNSMKHRTLRTITYLRHLSLGG